MKVRQAVFLFGTGLGFDHASLFYADGFGGLKIPFSFSRLRVMERLWRVASGTSSFGASLGMTAILLIIFNFRQVSLEDVLHFYSLLLGNRWKPFTHVIT